MAWRNGHNPGRCNRWHAIGKGRLQTARKTPGGRAVVLCLCRPRIDGAIGLPGIGGVTGKSGSADRRWASDAHKQRLLTHARKSYNAAQHAHAYVQGVTIRSEGRAPQRGILMKTLTLITLLLLTACGGGEISDDEPVCEEWLYVMPAQGSADQPQVVCNRWR